MNRNRYRFLLGGHDLEMNGIGEMLRQNRKIINDYHLNWSAILGSSSERLRKSRIAISIPGIINLLILCVISILAMAGLICISAHPSRREFSNLYVNFCLL